MEVHLDCNLHAMSLWSVHQVSCVYANIAECWADNVRGRQLALSTCSVVQIFAGLYTVKLWM